MEATSVGQIGLDLVVNKNGFDKQMSGIQGIAKKAGAALAGAFAVKKIIDFGKACIDLGSDLSEVQNVVDVTFPAMAARVDEFAQSAITTFGMSETMAKKFTGTFGAMAKSFGFTEQQAYDMSTTLTGLAGDVASFYNITQDEAYTKLKSVFTGETESLKDLGVVMNQTALDAYAMANGFGKTTSAMSEAEKVALRYKFVQEKLSAAQGDFARTSGSWANQVRVLTLQTQSIMATVGQGLINLFTPVIRLMNIVLAKIATLANAFKAFTELLTGNKENSQNQIFGMGTAAAVAESGLDSASDAADGMTSSANKAGNAAQKAAAKFRALMGFDRITKLSEPTSSDTTDGSSTGSGTNTGGNIPSIDFGSLSTGETAVDKLNSKVDELFNTLKRSIEPLAEQVERFGNIAKNAFDWFMTNVLRPLANFTINEVVPRFFETLANVMKIVNNVLIALQPLWQWFWDNVLKPIAEWTAGTFLTIWDGINAALSIFGDWCAANPEAIQNIATNIAILGSAFVIVNGAMNVWNGIAAIASGVTGALSAAFSFLTSPIGAVTLVIAGVIAAGVLLYQNWDVIKEKAAQLKDWLIEKFTKIKDDVGKAFTALKNKIFDSMSYIWKTIQEKWNWIQGKFQSFKDWIADAFTRDWTEQFGVIGGVLNEFFDTAEGVVGSIKTTFQGIVDFVTGVFTGDWRKAWNGVVEIFRGIFDGLASVFKAPLNGVIGMLNNIISIFNGFIRKINDVFTFEIGFENPFTGGYVGYKHTMNIPSLKFVPYLAEGGFVKKNTPQLAMIGDNRHQGEVVAPEDKLRQMAIDAVRAAGGNGITRAEMEQIVDRAVARIVAALGSLAFFVDSEELAKAVIAGMESIDGRYNPVKFT